MGALPLDSRAMRRVVRLAPRPRRSLAILFACLLAGSTLGIVPAMAQDRPACTDQVSSDCQLPAWEVGPGDPPSLFGPIDGDVWLVDDQGDAPAAGLDIQAIGVGRVDITEPGPVRNADGLLRKGAPRRAVPVGPGVVVRIILDRPLDEIDGGHAGIHVVTDVDGSRSNNAPAGVAAPDSPFAGMQDAYSVTYASTTGTTKLLASNLARAWYKDKERFAAAWAAPNVLDVLITPAAFGDGLRVVSFVSGPDGGYDVVGLGPAAVPRDGSVGLVPACVEATITSSPFVVARLTENGQTLRDVEAPASWRGGARLPLDPTARAAVEAFVRSAADDTGTVSLPSRAVLFEDGVVIGQRPVLELALDGETAELALELGLTRRGYNVLRDIELEPTGDELVDAWLGRATDALTETMPPFRSTRREGVVVGADGCLALLAREGQADVADGG